MIRARIEKEEKEVAIVHSEACTGYLLILGEIRCKGNPEETRVEIKMVTTMASVKILLRLGHNTKDKVCFSNKLKQFTSTACSEGPLWKSEIWTI